MMRTHYIADAVSCKGSELSIAGWVHETRNLGKIRFLLLRDRTGIIQITSKEGVSSPQLHALMDLPNETVICARGKTVASKIAQSGVEFIPSHIEVLSTPSKKVPLDVSGKIPSDIEVRLNNRHVDLRTAHASAIFTIEHTVMGAFREACTKEGFLEIRPPSIVAAATEGGSDLFKVQYFERDAYLAQSPQLYKQLAVIGGMDKVFMSVPVFRAEKHNTTSHLNEVLQMDVEMGFADHNDAMDMLEKVVLTILAQVKNNNGPELSKLNAILPTQEKIPRHTYSQLVELLQKNSHPFEWGSDFSREDEAKIFSLLGEELYFIYEWPTSIRAFYSMPSSANPKICNAFDLCYRGMEIASGAQRIHLPELIEEQLLSRGLSAADFEFYIDAFKVGAPPHAGWSIGLERIAMCISGQKNIRECALFPRDRTRLSP